MLLDDADTIAAIATPPGKGGVGVIRISGSLVPLIAQQLLKKMPLPRQVLLTTFLDQNQQILDQGIALYFQKPHSFTGEDVLELQGHGGVIVLDLLLQRIVELGGRLAKPGEFSQRAFLNNKMDLAQAEAVADLIDAGSVQAAKSAIRSLQGEFSRRIDALVEQLIHLRIMIEAAIDFPDEEIDFLADSSILFDIKNLLMQIDQVLAAAQQGVILREGITVVIAGKPNAGKSSLLNYLSGTDAAIVTDIAGTTRDVLKQSIHIDGMPLHIVDTAGLRESSDPVEQEGVRRAWQQIKTADLVLLMVDAAHDDNKNLDEIFPNFYTQGFNELPLCVVKNKKDLLSSSARCNVSTAKATLYLSAKTGEGIAELKQFLKDFVGYQNHHEGEFLARRRHLQAIEKAKDLIQTGMQQLIEHRAGELLAEDLRQAQIALSEITGEFTADDLLGKIFSSFCIGK